MFVGEKLANFKESIEESVNQGTKHIKIRHLTFRKLYSTITVVFLDACVLQM